MTTDPRALIIAGASILLIGVTGMVFTSLTESPAREATSGVRRPTAEPGTPVRQPEQSPPVPAQVSGDGVFIVGKTVQAGSYRTTGAPRCVWARLTDLKGGVLDRGRGPSRTQVDLVDDVAGFEVHGCPDWVMVR